MNTISFHLPVLSALPLFSFPLFFNIQSTIFFSIVDIQCNFVFFRAQPAQPKPQELPQSNVITHPLFAQDPNQLGSQNGYGDSNNQGAPQYSVSCVPHAFFHISALIATCLFLYSLAGSLYVANAAATGSATNG